MTNRNPATQAVEAPETDATVSTPASPEDDVTVTQTPETTTVTVPPPKTPEQIQQEAEQNGAISQRDTFDIWYPWYRHHIFISINTATIHLGFNPALPGGEIVEFSNIDKITSGFGPEENAHVFEEAILEASLGLLAAAAGVVLTANFRFLPATGVALGFYSVGLLGFIGMGYYLYSSGHRTEAKGYMLGLGINLIGVAIASLLPIRAAIVGGVMFAAISSMSSQVLDPTSLNAALAGALAAMYAALGVGIAALIYVPEPNSFTFKSVFPWVNLLFAVASFALLGSWLAS